MSIPLPMDQGALQYTNPSRVASGMIQNVGKAMVPLMSAPRPGYNSVLFPGSGMSSTGVSNSVNANAFVPFTEAKVIGLNDVAENNNANPRIAFEVFAFPTKYPPNNSWHKDIPWGAVVFMRNISNATKTDILMNLDDTSVQALRGSDDVQLFTPERLNFTLHWEALNAHTPYTSLYDVFQSIKLAGRMNTYPEPGMGSEKPKFSTKRARILGTHRKVNISYFDDRETFNYHGNHVRCGGDDHLHFVLLEKDLPHETMYVTDVEGNEVKYLGNIYHDAEAIMKSLENENRSTRDRTKMHQVEDFVKCRYAPQIVAVASPYPVLPDEALKYTVTGFDGKPIEKIGYSYYLGRCARNLKFRLPSPDETAKSLIAHPTDMRRTLMNGKMDVYINVKEYLIN